MRHIPFQILLSVFLVLSGCSTLAQINESLNHSSAVVEENTQKLEKTGQIIEGNTRQMEKTGIVINKNTQTILIFSKIMSYAFPVVCAVFILFNFVFFYKILKRLKPLSKENHFEK